MSHFLLLQCFKLISRHFGLLFYSMFRYSKLIKKYLELLSYLWYLFKYQIQNKDWKYLFNSMGLWKSRHIIQFLLSFISFSSLTKENSVFSNESCLLQSVNWFHGIFVFSTLAIYSSLFYFRKNSVKWTHSSIKNHTVYCFHEIFFSCEYNSVISTL